MNLTQIIVYKHRDQQSFVCFLIQNTKCAHSECNEAIQTCPPYRQTTITTATATDTQLAFLSKTDYATTGGEALWTLSNVFI